MTRKNRIVKIFAISLGHLCQDMYSAFLSPILPLIIEKFSLSYTAAGMIEVVRRIPFLFAAVMGAFSERLNLKYIVIITPTLTAVSMCLMGVASDYYIILILAFITGLSSVAFHVPAPVLVKDFTGRRIGLGMTAFQIGGESARALGPLIVTAAVTAWTMEGIYKLIPFGILSSIFFYFVFKDTEHKKSVSKDGIRNSIVYALSKERYLFISLLGILFTKSLTCSVIYAYLPVYLSDLGRPFWFGGAMLAVFQTSAVIGVSIAGPLSDKFDRAKLLLIFTFLTPFAMLAVINTVGWLFITSIAVLGFIGFAAMPIMLAYIQRKAHAFPSVANGINMSMNFVLNAAMVLLCGKLSDIMGMHTAFKICTFTSFAGLPLVLFLRRR